MRFAYLFLLLATACANAAGPVRLRIFPADEVIPTSTTTAYFEAFRSYAGGFAAPGGQIFTSTTWSTSDATIATIDNNGVATITGKSGTVTITAVSGPARASVPLTVSNATLTGITIAPASVSVPLGLRQQFRAIGNYSDSTQHDLTDVVLWDSSAVAATVNTFGLATTHAKGSAMISASLGAMSGSANLVVTDPILELISISPPTPALKFPATLQLTATGIYSDGSTKDLSATATWSSSDASIASINSSGLVASKNVGHATLTALQAGISGSTVITVGAEPLGTVTSADIITCQQGGPYVGVDGTCYSLNVSCPGVPDQNVLVKVAPATGAPKGTVILIGGGGANGFFDSGYAYGPFIASSLQTAGYTVVSLLFNDPNLGWLTGPGGTLRLACRPATTMQWVYDHIHRGGASAPFCANGESGGSSAIAYSLSHYGLGQILSMVEEDAGPVFTRLDRDCLCTSPPLTLPCGQGTTAACLGPDAEGFIDTTYAQPLCTNAANTGDTSNVSLFLGDSILSGSDALLSFPTTDAHFIYGNLDLTLAAANGLEYEQLVTTTKSMACVANTGHSMPNFSQGAQQIVSDLTTYCKLQ